MTVESVICIACTVVSIVTCLCTLLCWKMCEQTCQDIQNAAGRSAFCKAFQHNNKLFQWQTRPGPAGVRPLLKEKKEPDAG